MKRKEHEIDSPILDWSLNDELSLLKSEKQWNSEDRNAKTLIKTSQLCVILLVFHKGARMPEHHTIGSMTFLVLSGAIRFSTGKQNRELNDHEMISLAKGIPHDIEALTESSALLTIAYPQDVSG